MKQVLYAVAVLLFTQVTAKGQTTGSKVFHAQESKWKFGVMAGLAIPTGSLSETDYSSNKSGFSGTGGVFGASGNYLLKKHLSLSAVVNYQVFAFVGARRLADGFKDDFGVDSCTVSVEGRNYNINFLIGATWSSAITEKLYLDFRLLGGLSSAHLAGYNVYLEDNEVGTFGQAKSSNLAFAAQGGVGVRYDFTRRFGVAINADYLYTKPDFEITNTNRKNNAGRIIDRYNQPRTAINSSISLLYSF